MKRRVHVYYSGRVQGIGFRYTVWDLARKQSICGWVKNLPDGRVEMIAEAEESLLTAFLGSIEQYFAGYIADAAAQWLDPVGSEADFRVVY